MKQSITYDQKFSQWWIWLGLTLSSIIFFYIFFSALKKGEELFWIIYLSLIALIVLLVLLLFLFAKLQIKPSKDGLYYRFFPFHFRWKLIPYNHVIDASIIKYDAVGDFGGWGVRKGKNGIRALIVKGDLGIKFDLQSGKTLILGMQDEEVANTLLTQIQKKESK